VLVGVRYYSLALFFRPACPIIPTGMLIAVAPALAVEGLNTSSQKERQHRRPWCHTICSYAAAAKQDTAGPTAL